MALHLLIKFTLFVSFQSVYKVHYGNNETLVTVSYCNDYDDNFGFAFTIYQVNPFLIGYSTKAVFRPA